jgi:hypothetical protein
MHPWIWRTAGLAPAVGPFHDTLASTDVSSSGRQEAVAPQAHTVGSSRWKVASFPQPWLVFVASSEPTRGGDHHEFSRGFDGRRRSVLPTALAGRTAARPASPRVPCAHRRGRRRRRPRRERRGTRRARRAQRPGGARPHPDEDRDRSRVRTATAPDRTGWPCYASSAVTDDGAHDAPDAHARCCGAQR